MKTAAAVSVCLAGLTATLAPRNPADDHQTAQSPPRNYQVVEFNATHLGGMKVPLGILLPDEYSTSARRYPVLYLLHGGGKGRYSDFEEKLNLSEYAKKYREIIVMPSAPESWYVNSWKDRKLAWQDYLIFDVIPYIDTHYRTIASRSGRAIAGTSMGGFGAMLLGLKYPDRFVAVASVSGVLISVQPDWPYDAHPSRVFLDYKNQITAALGPVDTATLMANDPYELAKGLSWPRLRLSGGEVPQLYVSVGEQDELLPHNRKFVELLSDLRIPYEYREVPGPHDWPVLDKQIQVVLALQAPLIGAGGVSGAH